MLKFEHHLEAQKWVEQNAVGDICIIDKWTYGKMLFFHESGNYPNGTAIPIWTTV